MHIFGSAANGLGIRDNNDIDVSLSLPLPEDTREAKGALPVPPALTLLGPHSGLAACMSACAAANYTHPPRPTLAPRSQCPAGEVVQDLEQLFQEASQLVGETFAIPRARIPVIKAVWKPTGTKVGGASLLPRPSCVGRACCRWRKGRSLCLVATWPDCIAARLRAGGNGRSFRPQFDITLNNNLAVANTALLRDYAAIDRRLRQLVLLIKHWAKRRRVNDAYTGTLSSYAYCLLAIGHLQQRAPPVLPVLQEGPPTQRQTIGEAWLSEQVG